MNKRQILILEYLVKQQQFVSGDQLANRFGVSSKTIYQDLDRLNERLIDKNIGATIQKKPRKGIKLVFGLNIQSIYQFIQENAGKGGQESYSPEYRENVLFKKLFFEKDSVDLFDFSAEMFITEVSAQRDIKRLADFLKSFGVNLRLKHDQVMIDADEKNIRNAIKSYLIRLLGEQKNRKDIFSFFFLSTDISKCMRAIDQLAGRYYQRFSNEYYSLLLLECLVVSKRQQLGYPLLVGRFNRIQELNHLEVYFIAGELLENILKQPLNCIPVFEVEEIAYTLLAVGFEIQNKEYTQNLEEQVADFIRKVSTLLSLDLSKDKHLQLMLANHISSMIFRLQSQLQATNPVLEEIKKQYSSLFNVIWLASRDLMEYYELNIPDSELAFIVIHFQLAIEKIIKPLHIVVVCQHGIATSELIMNKVQKVFAATERIVNVGLRELNQYDFSTVDLVISSIQLKDLSVPMIEVSPIITSTELQEIRRYYEKLNSDNYRLIQTALNGRQFNVATLETFLHSPTLIKVAVKNKRECLDKLLRITSVQNQKQIGFVDSIYQRETIGSTSVYTGVALPHSDPRYVKHSELHLMTLDKPIEWGKNQVKMVLLIAIAERDIAVFKDSLLALYAVIENQNLMEELVQMEDGNKMRERLLEEVSHHVR